MNKENAIANCTLVLRAFGVQLIVVGCILSLLFLMDKFGRNKSLDHVHYVIHLAPGLIWLAFAFLVAGVILLIASGSLAQVLLWNLIKD